MLHVEGVREICQQQLVQFRPRRFTAPRRSFRHRADVPLEGHIRGFRLLRNSFGLLFGTVQLEDGLGSDLEDAVLHAVLLVFAAPQLAFHLEVRALLDGRREVRKLGAPDDAAVPLCARLPFAGAVLPGFLGRQRRIV